MTEYGQVRITKDGIESTIEVDATDLVSDGYHTFGELYDHRITLWIALCKLAVAFDNRLLAEGMTRQNVKVWRSKEHHYEDQKMYKGWFVLGMDDNGTNIGGQITYHLPLSRWSETDFAETLEHAPKWDGHTPQDVLERLKQL